MIRNLLRSKSVAKTGRIARQARPELTNLEGRKLLSGIVGQQTPLSVEIKHIGVETIPTSHIGTNILFPVFAQ